jgi:PPOX class probable F420-dependent enzyme
MTKKTTNIVRDNRDLLRQPIVAHLATSRPDGSLQSNPVWFEWDGEHVKFSTTRARQKTRNVEHDRHVALSIADPENPYHYVELRGVVDRVEEDPEREFIDHLSERYLGRPYPYHQPGDERLTIYVPRPGRRREPPDRQVSPAARREAMTTGLSAGA